jgi:RNA polymerase sigma-70 factor (ECF subfamily)
VTGATGGSEALDHFPAQRWRMFAIAYQMLGTASDAEDIVQDAWVSWTGRADRGTADIGGELARIVTSLCLARLETARAQRAVYDGPWLPEPVLTAPAFDGPDGSAGVLGPLDIAAQRRSVSFPLLIMLERLTPPERASCVLRDGFEYSHLEVAELLGTTEENARELHAHARRNIEWPRAAPIELERWQGLVDQLFAAGHDGDIQALEDVLREDVVARVDAGGLVSAARQPIVGREAVARYLVGAVQRFGAGVDPFTAQVNGEEAVVVLAGDEIAAVWFVHADREHVTGLDMVVNPQKLAFAQGQLSRVADPAGL